MTFVPAIGQSDFRKLREAGLGYIDKTDFLRALLADPSEVLLFSRPRRFGKTINLSALGYFLRKTGEDLSHLFQGLAVTRDPAAMAHFQRYPTLSVTFKDVKGTTFDETLIEIAKQIERQCREHRYLFDALPLDSGRTHRLKRLLSGSASKSDLETSLLDLTEALAEHHGERVVVLIDEYDTPIQSGHLHGFFEEAVLFFRNFLSAALKDNVALFKGVLTGILRVSKENMFSGLNNIAVHSILSPRYATAFGFTEEEVASIVEPSRLAEVRAWYNGYLFGGQVIYNPWSILNYVAAGQLVPYWVNTGSSDLIARLATQHGVALSASSVALLRGETIDVSIDDNVALRDIDTQPDALWSFLLFSGYLKLASIELREGRLQGALCIPNKEIQIVYEDMFRNWLHKAAPDHTLVDELVRSLLAGDAPTVESLLQEMLLRVVSFQDGAGREPEKLYHGLILGLLVHLTPRYDVRSNREAGYGRADVLMVPRTKGQPGVVMELKVPFGKETLDQALEKAARQIRARRYAAELESAGAAPIHEYAMAFDGKRARVSLVNDAD
ncbi:MAG: AAA family ATPase [Polyangiaceae bacterium]